MPKLGTEVQGNSKIVGVRLTDEQIRFIDSQEESKSEYIRSLINKEMKHK